MAMCNLKQIRVINIETLRGRLYPHLKYCSGITPFVLSTPIVLFNIQRKTVGFRNYRLASRVAKLRLPVCCAHRNSERSRAEDCEILCRSSQLTRNPSASRAASPSNLQVEFVPKALRRRARGRDETLVSRRILIIITFTILKYQQIKS
jgi:hypothetical protein